jgi:Ala-tRNA(Pro) deacylase
VMRGRCHVRRGGHAPRVAHLLPFVNRPRATPRRGVPEPLASELRISLAGGPEMYERLERFLRAKGARYRTLVHHGAVTAQEQAEQSRTSGWNVAKVLIVKERDGYALAVLPAACIADLNRLKGLLGHGEIRLADIEEIRTVVPDCVPGAVPPFGELFGLRTFVDRSLLDAGEITMPGGDLATAIRMRGTEFSRIANPRVGDFAAPEALLKDGLRIPRGRSGGPGIKSER